MAAIVEFRTRSTKLAMSEALRSSPDVTLDLVQEAGTDPDRPILIFWAGGGDLDAFEAALARDETVSDIQQYGTVSDRLLYRVRLTDAVELVSYPIWVDIGAEQIEVQYRDGWWHNRYRIPDTEGLETIERWCRENDVDFELEGIYSQEAIEGETAVVTPEQREVLRTALDMGYFEVPRDGTLEDVAGSLDISSQAASERLRRGHKQLIQQFL